jgi:hypothetical protein
MIYIEDWGDPLVQDVKSGVKVVKLEIIMGLNYESTLWDK